jgi:hypothetical protein
MMSSGMEEQGEFQFHLVRLKERFICRGNGFIIKHFKAFGGLRGSVPLFDDFVKTI